MKIRTLTTLLTAALLAAPDVPAAITVNDYWRMGENDPGASAGGTASNSVDNVGGVTLFMSGSPLWEPVMASAATTNTGSGLCIYFSTNSTYGTNAVISSIVDNFGLELWVKPNDTSGGGHCLAYNGNTGAGGWGVYQVGSTFQGLFGGVTFFGSAPVNLGVWTHVAIVRNSGTATLYIDGVPSGTTTATPNTPAGAFGVAVSPTSGGFDQFTGYLDEVRFFTFTAGQFNTNDLLFNAGPPLATTGAATGVSTTTAVLNGTANPHGLPSTCNFQFGTTTNYGQTSTNLTLPVGTTNSPISTTINNLSPGTLYHFRLAATNTAGTTNASDLTFTTLGAPFLVSASAANFTTSNAQLQAVVNPNGFNTTVQFFYGFDTNYGSYTASNNIGSGTNGVGLTNLLSYLFAGVTYHYKVVATNSFGTMTSPDFTFTLPGVSNAVVATTADGGPGSLRQAILDAAGGGTIYISATGVITLTNPLPVIFKGLTINGPGASNLTISGNNLWRLFFVDAGSGTVNINNLTLANGRAKGGDGGNGNSGGGGGLGAGGALFANSGSVVLSNLTFSGNSAAGGNGGNWVNTNSPSGGGGGGLGGNGGSPSYGGAGGGGFFGAGGSSYDTSSSGPGGGGGGGFAGNGGTGTAGAGGGGGAIGDGQDSAGTQGGAGGAGGGGGGANATNVLASASGVAGQIFGGGGGGGHGLTALHYVGGVGGAGGKFGGGGGSDMQDNGGGGGDFGGGGGAASETESSGGPGGFGGGGGGCGGGGVGGPGGFGGGGGGDTFQASAPGPFGGSGGVGNPNDYFGSGGGGGGALGGDIFIRGTNGASISIYNSSIDAGLLTPGAGGSPSVAQSGNMPGPSANPGQAAGTSMFALGGTNVMTITAGTNTIAGTVADWSGAPATLAKTGSGTLVLAATNSYSGSTLVNGGTLIINGDNTSSSNLYVNSGGTLVPGTGKVGKVTLNTGGTIAPGLGTLVTSNSVWSGAGNYNWQLYDVTNRAGIGYGTIQVNGTLDVSAASGFSINLWTLASNSPPSNGPPLNSSSLTNNSWTLVHTTGGIVGFSPTNFTVFSSPHNGAGGFSNSGPQIAFQPAVAGNDLVLVPVTQPPSLTVQPPSGITNSSATLNALVNPQNGATFVFFLWGTDASYGATNMVYAGLGGTAVSVSSALTGLLLANTVYHYQIIATNPYGTVASGDQMFTTPAFPPYVVTLGASSVTFNNAIMSGTVNPEGVPASWYFQYGTTTNYGSFTTTNSLSAASTSIAVSNAAAGLLPGTTWHFRLVATNSVGVSVGSDLSFTTLAVPSVAILSATPTTTNTALLAGNVDPGALNAVAWFQYGPTTNYGSFSATNIVPSGAPLSFTNAISGLAANTIYHVQLVATNSAGVSASPDATFAAWLPQLSTLAATAIGSHFATLNALLGTNSGSSAVWFQYGLTTNFGNFSTTNRLTPGSSPLLTGCTVTNVLPGNTYYFAAVASNSLGLASGQTLAFRAETNGTLVPLAYWRLGDIDPGAVGGIAATNTRDSIGSADLPVTGGLYSTDVSSTAACRDSSSLSLNFNNGAGYALGPAMPTLTNNFGIEVWVKPAINSGSHWIAYNGNTGNSGWGIFQNGANYQALFGGVTFFASAPVTVNAWTHLAIVRDNGVATLYVNGVPSGTTSSAPNQASGNFALATDPASTGSSRFNGLLDEVRVFTFLPGHFSTSDLLLNASAPPRVLSVSATATSPNRADLFATVQVLDYGSYEWFQYGPTTNYGNLTPGGGADPEGSRIIESISGLAANTIYHVQFLASNHVGISASADTTFSTWLPQLTTLPVTTVGSHVATLNALLGTNSGTSAVWFLYGSTPTFDSASTTNNVTPGSSPALTGCTVTNLLPGTTYYYAPAAYNGAGIAYGQTFSFTTATNGSLLPLAYWRLGEIDPGAAGGIVATNTRDSIASADLTVAGTPSYATDVSPTAANRDSSSLSLNFTGGAYAFRPAVSTLINNFGLEAWVKPATTSGSHWIAYNGNTGGNGWGIVQNGGTYQVTLGGIVQFGSGAATLNVWTHVALVRNNGTATLYVNGVPAGTSSSAPNAPSGNFGIAADPGSGTSAFNGLLDEVRVFTFPAGQFSTNDLLFNASSPPYIANETVTAINTNSASLSATVTANGGSSSVWFEYGLTTNYGGLTSTSSIPAGASLTISNIVTGLQPGTVYHFRADARSAGLAFGPDATFVTLGNPGVTILSATATSTNAALLAGTVDPRGFDSVAWFQYGPTTNYGGFSASNTVPSGAPISFTNGISGLVANTIYHVQLVASNSQGVSFSPDITFSTWLPQLTTLPPTTIGSHFATLNALLGTNGGSSSVWFQYGLTTNFGSFSTATPVSPAGSPVLTSVTVTNILPGNTYYFAAVASNNVGSISGQTLAFTSATNGTLLPLAYWRLGEIDPGAAGGIAATNTRDSIGSADLTTISGPTYATDVSSTASNRDSSSLSMAFTNGAAYAVRSAVSTLTDNFGLEAWVKPATTSGSHWIAYNGNTGGDGWGLFQNGGNYQGLFGGVAFFASAPVTVNAWTHLAIVRDNGVATLYVNGVPVGTTSSAPNQASGNFGIAADPGSGTSPLSGLLDEVRVFTFTAGQFSTNDLLLNASAAPVPAIVNATATSTNTALLAGTVDPRGLNSLAWFQYGPTTNYGSFSATNTLPSGAPISFTNAISGLAANTIYHVQFVASNSAGVSASPDTTFSTWLPQLNTLPATTVGSHFATLNALLGTNSGASTVWFQYGLTTNFGSFSTTNSLAPGSSVALTGCTVTNVLPGNTYYFSAVASNSAGTVIGQTLVFRTASNGSLIPLAYWRLGEIDPGAAAGIVSTNTRDSISSADLAVTGNPSYTTDVSPTAANRDSSSLSLNFTNSTGYARRAIISTLTNNFGLEAWVKPATTSGSHWIAYNGGTGSSGWGIIQNGSTYQVILGGIILFGSGTVTLNTWTHVALVRDSGLATLYVNGVPAGTNSSAPNPPSGNFGIAADPASGSSPFSGLLDEVRVFTFAPGQFSTNDLLLNVSSPAYITSASASGISSSSATLNATIIANSATSSAWFEYGFTTNYGNVTATNTIPAGSSITISNLLTNLQPGTLYHYRAVAINNLGIAFGQDSTFLTSGATASGPVLLTAPLLLSDGSFQFDFTNTPGASFTVLVSADINLPLTNWTALTNVVEGPAGHFRFTDLDATNNPQRFYRVRSP